MNKPTGRRYRDNSTSIDCRSLVSFVELMCHGRAISKSLLTCWARRFAVTEDD